MLAVVVSVSGYGIFLFRMRTLHLEIKLVISDKMKIQSLSVLQLEIEELKDNVSKVQSEIAMCMATLSTQHEKVCDAVKRLQSVSTLVKTIIEYNVAEDNLVSLNASFNNIEHEAVDSVALDISAIKASEELFNHSNIKGDDIKELSKECDYLVGKDDDRTIDTTADYSISTIRPTLSKKITAKVYDKIEDEAKTASSQTFTDSFSTAIPVQCFTETSFHGPLSSCQGTNSVKMTMNKVKDICRNHGWKLEGCHNTREGKENSAVVHFYKVSVKLLEGHKVVRGVGTNKAEAVKRAFKSMALLLRDAIHEEVGLKNMSNNGLNDNIGNFDEDPLLPSKPCVSSEVSLSRPPVYHAQDCEKYPTTTTTNIHSSPSTKRSHNPIIMESSGSNSISHTTQTNWKIMDMKRGLGLGVVCPWCRRSQRSLKNNIYYSSVYLENICDHIASIHSTECLGSSLLCPSCKKEVMPSQLLSHMPFCVNAISPQNEAQSPLFFPVLNVVKGYPDSYSSLRIELESYIVTNYCPIPGKYVHCLWMYEHYQRTMGQRKRMVVSPVVFSALVPKLCRKKWGIEVKETQLKFRFMGIMIRQSIRK